MKNTLERGKGTCITNPTNLPLLGHQIQLRMSLFSKTFSLNKLYLWDKYLWVPAWCIMLHLVCCIFHPSGERRGEWMIVDAGRGDKLRKALRKGWSVLCVRGFGLILIWNWGTSRLKASSAHPGILVVPFHSLWPKQEQKLLWTSEKG